MTYEIKKPDMEAKTYFFILIQQKNPIREKTVLHAAGIRESPKISLFLVSG